MKLKTPYLLRAKLDSWPHLFRTIIEIKPFRIHHGRQFDLWYERSNSHCMLNVIVWCGLFTSCRKLKTELYEKRDDFTFPIVNFLFISSNIPGSPAYVVYIKHSTVLAYSVSSCCQSLCSFALFYLGYVLLLFVPSKSLNLWICFRLNGF
jgi:hypothetical protein